jgi:hypothetical protein
MMQHKQDVVTKWQVGYGERRWVVESPADVAAVARRLRRMGVKQMYVCEMRTCTALPGVTHCEEAVVEL